MNAKSIMKQLRLREWGEMVAERLSSGKSVKAYCEEKGIREVTYYYRQKQAREAVCAEVIMNQPGITQAVEVTAAPMVNRWMQVTEVDACTPTVGGESSIYIEVNGCRVEVAQGVDAEHLATVCRILKAI